MQQTLKYDCILIHIKQLLVSTVFTPHFHLKKKILTSFHIRTSNGKIIRKKNLKEHFYNIFTIEDNAVKYTNKLLVNNLT